MVRIVGILFGSAIAVSVLIIALGLPEFTSQSPTTVEPAVEPVLEPVAEAAVEAYKEPVIEPATEMVVVFPL